MGRREVVQQPRRVRPVLGGHRDVHDAPRPVEGLSMFCRGQAAKKKGSGFRATMNPLYILFASKHLSTIQGEAPLWDLIAVDLAISGVSQAEKGGHNNRKYAFLPRIVCTSYTKYTRT